MAAQPDKKTVIKDLLELGKSKGQLSTKEILDALGEHVAANYIEGKKKEWEEYRTRVSSWEREKYIINY